MFCNYYYFQKSQYFHHIDIDIKKVFSKVDEMKKVFKGGLHLPLKVKTLYNV